MHLSAIWKTVLQYLRRVQLKLSLHCSFLSRPVPNFEGIFLISFLSQPSLREILHPESFLRFVLSQNSLTSHPLCPFKPLFSILFFMIWIFHFFIFRVFFSNHCAHFSVKAG